MSDIEGDETWFVIDTEKDFCIVEQESVVYDEFVAVGDKVKFFWSKCKELCGEVLFIGKCHFCRQIIII